MATNHWALPHCQSGLTCMMELNSLLPSVASQPSFQIKPNMHAMLPCLLHAVARLPSSGCSIGGPQKLQGVVLCAHKAHRQLLQQQQQQRTLPKVQAAQVAAVCLRQWQRGNGLGAVCAPGSSMAGPAGRTPGLGSHQPYERPGQVRLVGCYERCKSRTSITALDARALRTMIWMRTSCCRQSLSSLCPAAPCCTQGRACV